MELSALSRPTLTAITSYLDPPSLSALAAVNIYLNEHVRDDNTWRKAFCYQFLAIGPEHDLDNNKALLLRRTESSWRNEFAVRYKLKRRWERSRNAITTHIPVNSPISSIHLMPSHTLLTSSIQYGIVARSLPLTGKILPGYLGTSAGTSDFDAEFTSNISACAITSVGGTAKIVWGTRAGEVLFTNAPRATDRSKRIASDIRRCNVANGHDGSVINAQWAVNVQGVALGSAVVTASADGRIKLWDAKTAVCQWTSQRKSNAGIPDPCLKVTAAQTGTYGGCIAAVMKSGEIHIWTGFSLGSVAIYSQTSIKEIIIGCPISSHGYDPQATPAVIALRIDPNPIGASPTILVGYENHSFFYRIQTRTTPEGGTDIDITTFGDPSLGSTSILVPYFRGTAERQASFVLVGDHIGWVSLYAWDVDSSSLRVSNSIVISAPTSSNPNTGTNSFPTIQPIRRFKAHPDGTCVTALTWSPHTLITGSARGATHAFDALSFKHLRSFTSPAAKTSGTHQAGDGDEETAERDGQKVKQIIVGSGPSTAALNSTSGDHSKDKSVSITEDDRDLILVSVGERVMAWKAGPVSKHGGVGATKRIHEALGVGREPKYLPQLEVNQTISERHDHHPPGLGYNSYSSNSFGTSEHAQGNERDEEDEKDERGGNDEGDERDERGGREEIEESGRSENLGLSEAEAVEYVLMLSRDEANANIMGEGTESHMFPPIVSGGSGNAQTRARGLFREDGEKKDGDRRDNVEDTHKDKPHGMKKATEAVIGSASASASARNAWASGGPSLSARISPAPPTTSLQSHHYKQQQGGETGTTPIVDTDEDLKFAIELSLVEARSRGEDV